MAESTPVPNIPQLLIRNARLYGDKIAFSSSERQCTYAELENRTARLAGHLVAHQVQPGDYVVVLLDRCIEAVESILAVVRAGATAVPVDPRSSPAEVLTIFEELGPELRLVIRGKDELATFTSEIHRPTTIVLNGKDVSSSHLSYNSLMEHDANVALPSSIEAGQRALLHFTSGSSGGKLKGVASSQEAHIGSTFAGIIPSLHLTSDDKIFCPIPVSFSYGFGFCVIGALCTAAHTYLAKDEPLLEALVRERCTVIVAVPTTYRELVNSAPVTRLNLPLRVGVTAGAPMTSDLNSKVETHLGISATTAYGASETCGPVAMCSPGSPFVQNLCGAIMPGCKVRIVKPNSTEDVNHGGNGEVWVNSPYLMLGYRNASSDALTDGWYRTGDIGHWTELGQLMISGRLKEIIIRGGQNINPTDIERVLNSHLGVVESVVVGVPHDTFGEVPAALLVLEQPAIDLAALIAACRAVLPDYKVPVEFFEIEEVPRTARGKMKRSTMINSKKRQLMVHPLTATSLESMILAHTAAVCHLPRDTVVDPKAPFNDLGMTSLASIVLRDRLAAVTGMELSVTLIYDYPTPEQLSRHLWSRYSDTAGSKSNDHQAHTPSRHHSPIAIVSMACHLPGDIDSPEDLWKVLIDGLDVTSDFPTDRGWDFATLFNTQPNALGSSIARRGGFLHNMADFDATLFGISPREAAAMDPQQRILLESTWELLENGGIAPHSVRGSKTGVFMGVMYHDYAGRFTNVAHEQEGEVPLGSAASVTAGRVSYTYGLHGPSLAIDTACSSSLVAVHLAAESLRSGESTLAIAGGVTTMATPSSFVMFSKQRGLSPDGLCKSYSSDADGTVWSEGVGLILLERLEDALLNGHKVLGILEGSAVNSDGTSNGLTTPNGVQQEALIRDALKSANLSHADVDVIEGHGTATALGDPIEVRALLATYGQDRERPALLGSLKSNMGHTQAAAGVTGIIKMVMALQHGIIPRSIHVREPTRHVDWSSANLTLLTKNESWPKTSQPRRAAVSGFGIGGTNAHVIIGEYASNTEHITPANSASCSLIASSCQWLLSGASEAALRGQARRLLTLSGHRPEDVAYSLAVTRSALRFRTVITQGDANAMKAIAAGQVLPGTLVTVPPSPKLAVMFSGQGGQHFEMFKELRNNFPDFDSTLRTVAEKMDAHLKFSLLDHLQDSPDSIHQTDIAQMAIFAFQVSTYRMLERLGVKPDFVVGHSVGEIAAAHICGVLSLEDAARLVYARGKLMSQMSSGAMASVSSTKAEVQRIIESISTDEVPLTIAVINASASVVISGSEEAMVRAMEAFTDRGIRAKRLRISHACHSPMMEPVLPSLKQELDRLTFSRPDMPIVSTVTGKIVDAAEVCSPEYWLRQVVAPVLFEEAVATLQDLRASAFLEIGPRAALAMHVDEAIPTRADVKSVVEALANIHMRGITVDWSAVFQGSGAQAVDLPVYPFQRRRYWIGPPVLNTGRGTFIHPFLDGVVPVPNGKKLLFFGRISLTEHPWLEHHKIQDQVFLPATALAELALRAGDELGLHVLDELSFLSPVILTRGEDLKIQLVIEPDQAGSSSLDVYSSPVNASLAQSPTHHASGRLSRKTEKREISALKSGKVCGREIDIAGAYDILQTAGIEYGPAFQCVKRLWHDENTYHAELELPQVYATKNHFVHPALLDAGMHLPLLDTASEAQSRVPFQLTGVRMWASPGSRVHATVRILEGDKTSMQLRDADGQLVADIESVSLRALQVNNGSLHRMEWDVVQLPTDESTYDKDTVLRVEPKDFSIDDDAGTIHTAIERLRKAIVDWGKNEAQHGGRLIVVTEAATGDTPNLLHAALWGFVRSAQAEHGNRIILVDVDKQSSSLSQATRAQFSGHTVMALQDGRLLVPRLNRVQHDNGTPILDTSGTVLVTGGTGGLGALLSRHLVARYGAKHLVLISRSGPKAAHADRLQADLTAAGAQVALKAFDASSLEQLQTLLDEVDPPVSAVIHSAGVIDDGILESLTSDRISRVLRPKIDAALNLTRLLPKAATMVLFSSIAGMIGNQGQAAYAAGNTFLDALARLRSSQGHRTISLAWGSWQNEAGMAGKLPEGPLVPLTDQQGLDLFDAAMRSHEPVLAPFLIRGPLPPLSKVDSKDSDEAPQEAGSWRKLLAALPPTSRHDQLCALIKKEVGIVLGYDEVPDLPFNEIGLDSFTGVLLRNRISVHVSTTLPSTMAVDHPTASTLATFLLETLGNIPHEVTSTIETDHLVPRQKQSTERSNGAAKPMGAASKDGSLRLTALCQQLCSTNQSGAAISMLTLASLTLPTFALEEHDLHSATLHQLCANSQDGPAIVCIPDFFPDTGGTSLFAALIAAMKDHYTVYELRHPTKVVPVDLATLARTHASTISQALAKQQVVLLAYSAGGLVAHGVAQELGARCASLVLLDTYLTSTENPEWLTALPGSRIVQAGPAFGQLVSDEALLAMGHYMRLTQDWRPRGLDFAPKTLFLHAREPTAEMVGHEWAAKWPLADRTLEVPGNHASLLREHAASTAAAIRSWLESGP